MSDFGDLAVDETSSTSWSIHLTGVRGITGPTGETGPYGSPYTVTSLPPSSAISIGDFSYGTPTSPTSIGYSVPGVGTYFVTVNWAVTVDTANPGDTIIVYLGADDISETSFLFSNLTTDSAGVFPDRVTMSGLINVDSASSTVFNISFDLLTALSASTYSASVLSYIIQQVA